MDLLLIVVILLLVFSGGGATGLAAATSKPLGNVPRFFLVGYSTRRSRTTCLVRMNQPIRAD